MVVVVVLNRVAKDALGEDCECVGEAEQTVGVALARPLGADVFVGVLLPLVLESGCLAAEPQLPLENGDLPRNPMH